jgi:hypothetical protein
LIADQPMIAISINKHVKDDGECILVARITTISAVGWRGGGKWAGEGCAWCAPVDAC